MGEMSFAVTGPNSLSFDEGTEISFVDGIREGSLVTFIPTGTNSYDVRKADPDAINAADEVFVVEVGKEPGQIIFVRAEIDAVNTRTFEDELENLFAGSRFYYRDSDLPARFVDMYRPGMIIKERGFTDASSKRGGFAARHRFLIISCAAQDLSQIDTTDPERGLCVMQRDSYFKVLDLVEKGDVRQTTLLHIPEGVADFFSSSETDFERGLISDARRDFEELCESPPFPALTKQSWLERLTSPLGISDDGEFFGMD